MRKLILFLLVFVSAKVSAQVYQEMPQYGYRANRMAFDSTLQIPTVCGVPTLKSIVKVNKSGAIAYDSCNAIFYTYNPKTLTWTALTGGGNGSTDTTSLSNRINLKLNIADTSNMLSKYLRKTDTASLSNRINLKLNISDTATMLNPYLRKIDTTNKFVNRITRTIGNDSIIYFVGGNRFAIKDSVGTNPAPVGYYGAFQDTTTQTAVSINTGYGVKLGVTDLSNGVAISNNTRIKIANAGIYNIQFSLQLEKTGGSGNMIADIWLRKNGVNLQGTTGKVVLTGSTNASPVVASWNYVIAVSSNDSLELMWSTTNDNVVIKASPATAPHPSIPSAILTVTQQSGIMAGTGISPLDTANMLSNYARTNLVNTKLNSADTASLSNRINLKLDIADTSVFQRKSLSAYTIMANNTNATANATAQAFKDTSGTYTGTITWNGTAPTSGTFSYRWTRIGKMVNINIALVYANAGTTNTQVVVTLPADAPNPTKPAGLTSASNMLYPCIFNVNITNQSTLTTNTMRSMLRSNSGNNGFEFFAQFASSASVNAFVTCTYFTD
jgi:hypothetical protein